MADDPDIDDLRLVADAFRGEQVSRGCDQASFEAAFQAALRAYLAAHPEREAALAAETVADLIHHVSMGAVLKRHGTGPS